jgi:hypothetical protein
MVRRYLCVQVQRKFLKLRVEQTVGKPLWKQLKCPTTTEWINRLWYIIQWHKKGQYEKYWPLTHSMTWRDHACIVLNPTYCRTPFVWCSYKGGTIGTENRLMVSRSWGGGEDWTAKESRATGLTPWQWLHMTILSQDLQNCALNRENCLCGYYTLIQ